MATDNVARGLAAHALSVAVAGGGDHPVESVNGKTGKVNLTAADVGALSLNGGTLNGDLDLNDHEIINAYIIRANAQPTDDDELTRKDYVDNAVAAVSGAKFVINLTEDANTQTYTADKTWDEIKAAYESFKILAVHIGSSELPLMNGQISDGAAGFTFGYTNIIAAGTSVATRAIHYLHTDSGDTWEDADAEGEYLSVNGGTMAGALILNAEPVGDEEAANKGYVDARHFKVTFQRDPVAGLNADHSFSNISAAASGGKTVIAVLDNNEYQLSYATDTEMIFSGITGSIATEIIYANGVWTQTTVSLLPTTGGTMSDDIDMGGNSIINAQKIHVDGAAPFFIGSTIEPTGTSGTRLTGTTAGDAAFVKADKQAEYVPVYVGTPTENSHSANKKYVDDAVGAANIARYSEDGQLYVADAPTADNSAVCKKYVDNAVLGKTENWVQVSTITFTGNQNQVEIPLDGYTKICVKAEIKTVSDDRFTEIQCMLNGLPYFPAMSLSNDADTTRYLACQYEVLPHTGMAHGWQAVNVYNRAMKPEDVLCLSSTDYPIADEITALTIRANSGTKPIGGEGTTITVWGIA